MLLAEDASFCSSADLHAPLQGEAAHLTGEAGQVEALPLHTSHVLLQVETTAAATALGPKKVDEVLPAVEPAVHGKAGGVQGGAAGGAGEARLVQGEIADSRQSLLLDQNLAVGTAGHVDAWSLPVNELIFVSAGPRSVSYWFAKVPAL